MKKIFFLLFFLTACSFNNTNDFWNESVNSNYEELKYDKDYTLEEYRKILEKYNAKSKTPNIN